MNTHIVGVKGEDVACNYLKKHKYKILERNFHYGKEEIDIVAMDGKYVVFVEVKARSSDAFGLPREAVNYTKQQSIISAARFYLVKNKIYGSLVRFDVVEILNNDVTLLKDAFRMSDWHPPKR